MRLLVVTSDNEILEILSIAVSMGPRIKQRPILSKQNFRIDQRELILLLCEAIPSVRTFGAIISEEMP